MLQNLLPALLIATCVASAGAEDRPVAANAKSITPLKVGDALPDVSVKDAAGKSVNLGAYHADGPIVTGKHCFGCTAGAGSSCSGSLQ
jgi:hypothetical protein